MKGTPNATVSAESKRGRPRLAIPNRPEVCPQGDVDGVTLWGTRQWTTAPFRRQRFRCVPSDGSKTHWFSLGRRRTTEYHPAGDDGQRPAAVLDQGGFRLRGALEVSPLRLRVAGQGVAANDPADALPALLDGARRRQELARCDPPGSRSRVGRRRESAASSRADQGHVRQGSRLAMSRRPAAPGLPDVAGHAGEVADWLPDLPEEAASEGGASARAARSRLTAVRRSATAG